jgi:hypothetical protein
MDRLLAARGRLTAAEVVGLIPTLDGPPSARARLAWLALAGSAYGDRDPEPDFAPAAPLALVYTLADALARVGRGEPEMPLAEFLLACRQAGPAAPVRTTPLLAVRPDLPRRPPPPAAGADVRGRGRHRGSDPPRRPLSRTAAALAVLALTWAGTHAAASARGAEPRPVGPASGSPNAGLDSNAGWLAVVRRLAAVRARAFRLLDPGLLAGVYLPGSPPARTDAAQISALRRLGARPVGFAVTVTAVRLLPTGAGPAGPVRLLATERAPPYPVQLADGRRLAVGRTTVTDQVTLTLVRAAGGWRISSVRTMSGEQGV